MMITNIILSLLIADELLFCWHCEHERMLHTQSVAVAHGVCACCSTDKVFFSVQWIGSHPYWVMGDQYCWPTGLILIALCSVFWCCVRAASLTLRLDVHLQSSPSIACHNSPTILSAARWESSWHNTLLMLQCIQQLDKNLSSVWFVFQRVCRYPLHLPAAYTVLFMYSSVNWVSSYCLSLGLAWKVKFDCKSL